MTAQSGLIARRDKSPTSTNSEGVPCSSQQLNSEYETVRRLLGHHNIRTTVNFYCGLETIHATEAFGRIIQDYVKFEPEAA